LPSFIPLQRLDTRNPISMGGVGMPEVYTEAKKACLVALENSYHVIIEHWMTMANKFGRIYKPIETYKINDAETLFVTMGSISETCMTAVDEMRDKGDKIGLVHIRLWRPFPYDDFFDAVVKAKKIIILDRALSPGGVNPPVAAEIKGLFYNRSHSVFTSSFVVGLGGRNVTRNNFKEMYVQASNDYKLGKLMSSRMVGVKE